MSRKEELIKEANKAKAAKTNDLYEWLRLDGHNYSLLSSAMVVGGKDLAFSHKDCKYYVSARKECSAEMFAEFRPYLRWEFDQIEAVTEEIEVEEEYTTKSGNTSTKKVKKSVPTGDFINKFPPTTENILAKKREVLEELYASESAPTPEQVAKAISRIIPRLGDHERMQAIIAEKGASAEERLLRKFVRTFK